MVLGGSRPPDTRVGGLPHPLPHGGGGWEAAAPNRRVWGARAPQNKVRGLPRAFLKGLVQAAAARSDLPVAILGCGSRSGPRGRRG